MFTEAFPHRPLAAGNRLLARNLGHILEALPAEIVMQNVLLYFHRANFNRPQQVVNALGLPLAIPQFKLVYLEYDALGESGYFKMA